MIRRRWSAAGLAAAVLVLNGCAAAGNPATSQSGTAPSVASQPGAGPLTGTAQEQAVRAVVEPAMREHHLRAVIVEVRQDGDTVARAAYGDSMTGVPATTDMHVRNGAVAISYVAMALLQLVDEGVVTLEDPLSEYLPDVPHADRVTLRQLVQMTSGYSDYVRNPRFMRKFYADPFRQWTDAQKLPFGVDQPLSFQPGTNWGYAHTNIILLGQVLSEVTGKPLADLLAERVLTPLGLTQTSANDNTATIPEPVLHSYTDERRSFLDIPPAKPFLEDATFWNPSWTLADGAIETTSITDLASSAQAWADGTLLSPASHEAMISTDLRGFGHVQTGCSCFPQSRAYAYGLGIVTSGDWVLQNPLFAGHSAVAAALRDGSTVIATSVTFEPAAFDKEGDIAYDGKDLFTDLAAALVPDHPVGR